MAKGNLFLGTAARSVGDVVMYRREGAQVSRVRVRKIANPKTDAQCLQRAFMSACVKFYQPLANVLDRSWQGKSRAKSYAAFLKANAPKVRAAGWFIPKGTGFFPLPLQLSEGTLPVAGYDCDAQAFVLKINGITTESTNPATIGDLSSLYIGDGYQNGDVVTFIFTAKYSSNQPVILTKQFIIDSTSAENISTIMPWDAQPIVDGASHAIIMETELLEPTGMAVIVARNVDGVWQRSKQFLDVNAGVLTPITSDAAKTACIESYKGAAASDNPLVYLDGDELTD